MLSENRKKRVYCSSHCEVRITLVSKTQEQNKKGKLHAILIHELDSKKMLKQQQIKFKTYFFLKCKIDSVLEN